MEMVQWEDAFNLGVEPLDEHHRHLVDLLNRAYNALMFEHDTDEINSISRELVAYTDYHFKAEEQLMEQFSYGQAGSHVFEHESFKMKLTSLGVNINGDVIFFLEEWLLNHIAVVDKTFAVFLKSKGYTGDN